MKLLWLGALAASAAAWHVLWYRAAPRLGLRKPNFLGSEIMASYGVVSWGYYTALIAVLISAKQASWHAARIYVGVTTAMCVLGLIDDIWGSREVGGFAGHFKRLFTQAKVTTGAVKALGGGLVGVAAGYAVSGGDPVRWLLAALLIPLSANLLNLLDLRPGRAAAVFFAALGVTCIAAWGKMQAPLVVAAIAVVALAWATVDSRGRAMMGDSGSNSLGAALGLTVALNTGPLYQAVTIAAIAAIHAYSEKRSISDLIERSPVLRRVDRILGVR